MIIPAGQLNNMTKEFTGKYKNNYKNNPKAGVFLLSFDCTDVTTEHLYDGTDHKSHDHPK